MPGATDEQKKCISTLVGPVDVSAGAGSGKTFTLTQRIAHALEDAASGVDDIDQVCAITFTEKAAAELKGRVRAILRQRGMFDQALKVDASWISTIHGMCSRILRESALELGIDPQFKVLTGQDANYLMGRSIDAVLDQAKAQDEPPYAQLLAEFPFKASMGTSVSGLLAQVLDAAANTPGGLGALRTCQVQQSASSLAKALLLAYQDLLPVYQDLKSNASNDKAVAQIEEGIEVLQRFLASGDQSAEGLLDALDGCAMVRKSTAKAAKEACAIYQTCHYLVLGQALMMKSAALTDQLIGLAGEVQAEYARQKAARGALDMGDLVSKALEALETPKVHGRYADKFRLVMVDEFQDTDALQLAIVRHLAGPDMCYLCTVGDAQQSIYGFRGADIDVYRAYRSQLDREVPGSPAQPLKLLLSRNFRSHADVLAFVKCVCAQECVFGSGFLDLSASYDGAGYQAKGQPRVQLFAAITQPGEKVGVDSLRQAQAESIADYFQAMHEAGHPLSDLVLLLGSTTKAQLYAQAIRAKGYDCIIAGGSLFSKAPEVQLVGSLLACLANPLDSPALFAVLKSPLFQLKDEDLLALATGSNAEDGAMKACKLGEGLADHARRSGLPPALAHAVAVLSKAQRSVRYRPLYEAARDVLVDTGYLGRLQTQGAEGLAVAGNIAKALDLAESIESDPLEPKGASSVARLFAENLRLLRETPGALNVQGQEAVRIMTIHSSKGLEFPVVVLAEFNGSGQQSGLVVRKVEGVPYASLKPAARKVGGKDVSSKAFAAAAEECAFDQGALTADDLEAFDPLMFHTMLNQAAAAAQAQEKQRLFYVGATRAKEALGVFMAFKVGKTDPAGSYTGLVDDIRSALFDDDLFPDESQDVDYGGSEPARFNVRFVYPAEPASPGADVATGEGPAAGEAPASPGADAATGEGPAAAAPPSPEVPVCLPRVDAFELPRTCVAVAHSRGICSYSSLSGALQQAGAGIEVPSEVAGAGAAAPADAGAGAPPEGGTQPGGARPDDEPFTRPQEALLAGVALGGLDDDDEYEHALPRRQADDADKATAFGSALHRLCQIAAQDGAQAALDMLEGAATTYGVRDAGRLKAALDRWLSSKVAAQALSFGLHQPEVSFSLQVGGKVLEGQIDLLCTQPGIPPASQCALVVDYKTGGYSAEAPDALHEKHIHQARCYALAVLEAGYAQVRLVFARVEQPDPSGEDALQKVEYAFSAEDAPALRAIIGAAMRQVEG